MSSASPFIMRRTALRRNRSREEIPTSLLPGVPETYVVKEDDFLCPLCLEIIDRAHAPSCGHSFCYECIRKSLEVSAKCPKCGYDVRSADNLFPNLAIECLAAKRKRVLREKLESEGNSAQVAVSTFARRCDYGEVLLLLASLEQRRDALQYRSWRGYRKLTVELLRTVQQKKASELRNLQADLDLIDSDIRHVEATLDSVGMPAGSGPSLAAAPPPHSVRSPAILEKGRRWERISAHFSDFEDVYFECRCSRSSIVERACGGRDTGGGDGVRYRRLSADRTAASLDEFGDRLSRYTRYGSFKTLATLQYNTDMYSVTPNASIVSGIDFDKDCEYFAIAGVTRKVKIFDYNQVMEDVVDVHCPVTSFACPSKVSCVSWNRCHKFMLATSDYDGSVTLWDVTTGTKVTTYAEHDKRCWCIDFSRLDPMLLASGADDHKVKVWSLNAEAAVATLTAKANVCCVQFDPSCAFRLAYGCADHCVHLCDLRNPTQPVATLHGHKRAVSFIRFMDDGCKELVSASVDSQLKLWSLDGGGCVRTFYGHVNEKNFVGLATNGEYVACGSEDNTVRLFHKGFSREMLRHKFEIVHNPWKVERGRDENSTEFVSAVAWKHGSNVVLAANSQGLVKIMELA